MKKRNLSLLLLISFACASCTDTTESLFTKLIATARSDDEITYLSYPDPGDGKTGNEYYDGILTSEHIDYEYLYKASLSTRATNISFEYMNRKLQEGDIALSLIWNSSGISDEDFDSLIPEHLVDDYATAGSVVLFDWMRENPNNRKYVVSKTFELMHPVRATRRIEVDMNPEKTRTGS